MADQPVHALREIDLTIVEGEMVAIMGPSGSGKTTFMNIVGCLDRPTSGEYLLSGKEVGSMSDNELAALRNGSLGFVFQSFNLMPRRTALGNVELPLAYSPAAGKGRALAALAAVGLSDRTGHRPSELSGGQQQRVAIARAIVNDPVLVLADEPTGNLDSQTGEEIMSLFKDLNASGKTILIVTHEPSIAEHCRRVIRFQDGRVESDSGG
jgi:putative ABC transport system ATP-binding protein